MADQASFNLTVAGVDVSERFNQILESIEVTDKSGATSDTARISLSDDSGRIIMPGKGDPVSVSFGWNGVVSLVFDGIVDDVRHHGSRQGGRILTIGAKGFDANGKAKEPLEFHQDDGNLESFMSKAAQKAGLKGVKVSGAFSGVERKYWAATTESFIHLGHRMAREVGGTFKIVGDMAIIADRNAGESVSGKPLSTVEATLGVNLLDWDISPIHARPRYGKASARWYDVTQSKWRTIDTGVDQPGGAPATHRHRHSRADQGEAAFSARSNKKASERNRGTGHVLIIGDPTPQPEGPCIVSGARPGIDGMYLIDQVGHRLSRGSGYRTRLGLKMPSGTAGVDSRTDD